MGTCASAAVATVITVNPLPGGTISGPSFVCLGATITLTDITPGGTWSASNTSASVVSTGSASAMVTGVALGTDVINYTSTNMCGTGTVSSNITIDPIISSSGTISGLSSVCTGSTIYLSTSAPGGAWSASNGDVTILPSTGTATGVAAGIDTIIYTAACATSSATKAVTVHPTPTIAPISGADTICAGATTSLSDAAPGGTWLTLNPAIATVSSAGTTGGVAYGSATIRYTLSNAWCSTYASKALTVFAPTSAISGSSIVCLSSAISLSDAVVGGAWSTTNGHATVVSTGGGTASASGITTGTDTVVYTNTNMCGTASVTKAVSVNPSVVAGSISGATTVCLGAAAPHYTETAPGGTWSTSNSTVATMGPAGYLWISIAGFDTVIYTVNNGCNAATARYAVTVGPYAGTISGPAAVCAGATIPLTDAATGGAWSVSNSSASVSAAGVVTGVLVGIDTVSYATTSTCGSGVATAVINISGTPSVAAITGPTAVCAGATITAADPTGGGAWSETTGMLGILPSGAITGITAGTDTIKYTITNACGAAIASRLITINPLPAAGTITTAASVCVGATATATDAAPGGLWSETTGNASITRAGIISGVTAGSDLVSYTVTNSCGMTAATWAITIAPLPDAGTLTSATSVCVGATASATDAAPGGVWTETTGNASITGAGVITGVTAGSDIVSYTVINSCGTAAATWTIAIAPLPDAGTVTSTASVCVGATATATDAAPSGVWSETTGNASITGAGVITGVTAGSDLLSYTVTNSCGTAAATWTIAIASLPDAGTVTSDAGSVCTGATIAVNDAATGGIWSTSNGDASVTGAGIVTGIAPGPDTVQYTVTNTCGTTMAYTVVEITDCNTSGIPTVNTSSINVYPNPATSILNIEWTNMPGKTATVVIADITNRIVWKGYMENSAGKGVLELNLPDLSDGVYMLSVSTTAVHYTKKIVVSAR